MAAAADPVELRPGHGHVAVVIGVVAGAAEGLLGQEHQVLLRQASVALHLSLVLHVDGVAQLRPQHLVWYEERHAALRAEADLQQAGLLKGLLNHELTPIGCRGSALSRLIHGCRESDAEEPDKQQR